MLQAAKAFDALLAHYLARAHLPAEGGGGEGEEGVVEPYGAVYAYEAGLCYLLAGDAQAGIVLLHKVWALNPKPKS